MISNSLYKKLDNMRKEKGAVAIALLDPDKKNDKKILKMLELINKANFDVIFVGGSEISDNEFNSRIKKIKNNTKLPVIIFPGSSNQISHYADGILYISLISGRNPEYLIGEHVKSATLINKYSLEVIPTGYLLIDGGIISSVEKVSKTPPLPMNDFDLILSHALASQYLGKSFIFLETGSGAKNHISPELVKYLIPNLKIPIMIGGGINTAKSARELAKLGAGYIVIGTKIESLPPLNELEAITEAIHLHN